MPSRSKRVVDEAQAVIAELEAMLKAIRPLHTRSRSLLGRLSTTETHPSQSREPRPVVLPRAGATTLGDLEGKLVLDSPGAVGVSGCRPPSSKRPGADRFVLNTVGLGCCGSDLVAAGRGWRRYPPRSAVRCGSSTWKFGFQQQQFHLQLPNERRGLDASIALLDNNLIRPHPKEASHPPASQLLSMCNRGKRDLGHALLHFCRVPLWRQIYRPVA